MLFRTIVNSTKLLFLYLLIQPPSPKIKIPQNSNFEEELGSRLGGLRFGIDAEGNYGYKKAGADTVIPFNSGKFYDLELLLTLKGDTIEVDLIGKRELILIGTFREIKSCIYINLDTISYNKVVTFYTPGSGGNTMYIDININSNRKSFIIKEGYGGYTNILHTVIVR